MPGYVVADVAALKAIDTTGVTDTLMRFVISQNAWYIFDSTLSLTNNDEWIIEPTTGGGNWTPGGPISGFSTPSGAADKFTIYCRKVSTSSGDKPDAMFVNIGGPSAFWESTDLL